MCGFANCYVTSGEGALTHHRCSLLLWSPDSKFMQGKTASGKLNMYVMDQKKNYLDILP